jgi:hypothetical protein
VRRIGTCSRVETETAIYAKEPVAAPLPAADETLIDGRRRRRRRSRTRPRLCDPCRGRTVLHAHTYRWSLTRPPATFCDACGVEAETANAWRVESCYRRRVGGRRSAMRRQRRPCGTDTLVCATTGLPASRWLLDTRTCCTLCRRPRCGTARRQHDLRPTPLCATLRHAKKTSRYAAVAVFARWAVQSSGHHSALTYFRPRRIDE